MQETSISRTPSDERPVRKLFIRTFGCQMNEYDSDKMADVLNEGGPIELTATPDDADIILFNTCSVREKAQEKVFSDLGRVRHLKQLNPNLVIGVGGCVASQEGKAIVERAPFVDIVFGPQTLHRLPDLISKRRDSGKAQVDISFPEIEKFDNLPPARVDGPTAYVSIMEGCSKYCSFCVVPYTRGIEISRPFDDVLIEVADLADQGVKEITLLGQNVNAYRGPMSDSSEIADFAMLLEYVHEIPGIERIRYTTSHPKEMTTRLIEAHGKLPKLVPFLHLPVQAGSDNVLNAMKRGYTSLEFKSIVRRLRAARPGMTLSSDFIVGFPGETEAEFEKTMQLIRDVGFDTSFSFVYSRRPGTPAADLHDDTSKETKFERLHRLQALINEQANAISESMVGTEQQVLIERLSRRDDSELMGRTENNRIVNFPANSRLIGQMVTVRITQALTNTLRGEIVTAESTTAPSL
ncbi:tRNA (N6-isopentenyl adenosine(37)-C2)-methylthiotransferase MiaB [Paenalcaligenes niemegkensis]|uniref:tRNA (N6-isopentenyl adenosine(37)-C2)-methylthiotransferase MiaB n=1 Tax=Paenalcaligenes niemegkensis TaxID=2895469 RepID=UPI001EE83874|nr:tRNA (N6-isopentenyl adenosine(37)-C2)-methylthiotransferase MiaB [Paenalcaligenes niemegkensis]MCQ9617168.1 tRNA (N6-isopentenyl adenosine(37)-C2)-methylthiotransferase MiaB [Paenalcaligenes niemegkensis]